MARPKGSKDKASKELRLVIAGLVEANSHKFQKWLDCIEVDEGPLEAFKRVESLLEYCIPKLARSELTGANGGDIKINHTSETDLEIINRALGKLGGQTHDGNSKTLQ